MAYCKDKLSSLPSPPCLLSAVPNTQTLTHTSTQIYAGREGGGDTEILFWASFPRTVTKSKKQMFY